MSAIKVLDDIYWVGVIDWNMRHFHGNTYATKRGTTYNAYLILDEKITLVDTVYRPFAEEMIARIREIVPPEKIEIIIANHVETDHSGALTQLLKHCPNAKIYGSVKCREGLEKHYHEKLNFQTVVNGDTLNIGKRTLRFLMAAMIHWPDSMFTYCVEDQLLMPNDGFGQHYATSERFDDEADEATLMEETGKYYANILWPFSGVIARKLEEVAQLSPPIKMIAPSHGLIWRKNPAKAIQAYQRWSRGITQPKAVIVYETMWQSTDKMARAIAQGVMDAGVRVRLFDIAVSDRTEVVYEMFEARGFIFGSSTHDNDALPIMTGFLSFFKGLKPKNRMACAFGSYGWAGGAVPGIERYIQEAGVELAQPGLSVQYVPTEDELRQCYEFGGEFARKIKIVG